MTVAEAKMYVRNARNIIEVFGEEIFAHQAGKFRDKDFSNEEYVQIGSPQDAFYREKGYPVVTERTTWPFTEYKGNSGWQREIVRPARSYRTPCPYQTQEDKLIKGCIEEKWPFMRHFKYDAYHLDQVDSYEIYVTTETGVLYLPIKALLEKDFSIAEKRMKTYFGDYYRLNVPLMEKSLAALATPTTEKLTGYLTGTLVDDPSRLSERPVKPLPKMPESQKDWMAIRIGGMRKTLQSYAGTETALEALRLFEECLVS